MEVGVLVFCLEFHEKIIKFGLKFVKISGKKFTEKNTENVHINVITILST
jgi:hypothetical protein